MLRADDRRPVDAGTLGDGVPAQNRLDPCAELLVAEIPPQGVDVPGEAVRRAQELPDLAVDVLRPQAAAPVPLLGEERRRPAPLVVEPGHPCREHRSRRAQHELPGPAPLVLDDECAQAFVVGARGADDPRDEQDSGLARPEARRGPTEVGPLAVTAQRGVGQRGEVER
jgi:hypothetical protein